MSHIITHPSTEILLSKQFFIFTISEYGMCDEDSLFFTTDATADMLRQTGSYIRLSHACTRSTRLLSIIIFFCYICLDSEIQRSEMLVEIPHLHFVPSCL